MHTMYIFLLGTTFGSGLILAIQELQRQLINHRARKSLAFQAAVNAEADRRELDAWGISRSPHRTGVDLTLPDAGLSFDQHQGESSHHRPVDLTPNTKDTW